MAWHGRHRIREPLRPVCNRKLGVFGHRKTDLREGSVRSVRIWLVCRPPSCAPVCHAAGCVDAVRTILHMRSRTGRRAVGICSHMTASASESRLAGVKAGTILPSRDTSLHWNVGWGLNGWTDAHLLAFWLSLLDCFASPAGVSRRGKLPRGKPSCNAFPDPRVTLGTGQSGSCLCSARSGSLGCECRLTIMAYEY